VFSLYLALQNKHFYDTAKLQKTRSVLEGNLKLPWKQANERKHICVYLVCIWEEGVVGQRRYNSGIFLVGLRKAAKTLRITSVPAES
jgi:hypothetical protein